MLADEDTRPALTLLRLGADRQAWAAAGFTLSDHALPVGGVTIEFISPVGGIEGLGFDALPGGADDLDGIPLEVGPALAEAEHDNGVFAVDQVVIATPDFDRTAVAMSELGLGLRREAYRELDDGTHIRQGFVRAGEPVLELVHTEAVPGTHAHGWGLGFITSDLDKAMSDLEGLIGPPRDAVQPGRRIATFRRDANLGLPVVLMDPVPPQVEPADR